MAQPESVLRFYFDYIFSYDDFPCMEMVLSGKDPLDSREREKWQRSSPNPSSVRRRMRHTGEDA